MSMRLLMPKDMTKGYMDLVDSLVSCQLEPET